MTSKHLTYNVWLEAMSLESLFDEAAKYGRVTVFSGTAEPHPNCYKVDIDFHTREHTKMTASSERNLTIKSALIHAVSNAHDMVQLARRLSK